MALFKWSDSYATNLPDVDEQHQELINIINELGLLLEEDDISLDEVESIFSRISDYVKYHFSEEEKVMQESCLDERFVKKHIEIHNRFIEKVNVIYQTINSDTLELTNSLFSFLTRWLTHHILGQDQDMANQIKAIKVGISPKDAFEMLEAERNQSSANELLDVFDALLKNISLSHQRLQEINLTLEQRVEQTDRANKQLSILNTSLEELSFKDVLTGIPNRRYAIKYLSSAWELAQTINQSISCVVIDADFFKEVNDNYGHDVGDVVLIKLAKALNKNFRDKDVVCRLGGDEFLVILPDTDIKTAMKVAERVRSNIAKMKIKTGGKPWVGSISVGIASKDKSMKSFDQLIKKADKAVYLAKEGGRNCVKCVE